jgi:ABC-2 type transport system permease protein
VKVIWIIAKHEYLTSLRRPGFIILTLIFPLLGALGLLIAASFGGQVAGFFVQQFARESRPMGIVDHSGYFTPVPQDYVNRFLAYPDEETARQALLAKTVNTYLVIPADYLQTGRVLAYSQESFGQSAVAEIQQVRAFFVHQLLAGKVDDALLERAVAPVAIIPVNVSAQETPTREPLSLVFSLLVPYFFAILLIMTIFVSSGYLLQSVGEEKESRVIEIILSSVSARQLLAGKIIGMGALGLTQVLIWILSAWALSGGAMALLTVAIPLVVNPKVMMLALVYYFLGFILYAVLLGSVGSLGTTMRESQQLAGLFSFAAALPIMLSGLLFTNPNMLPARLLSYFPLTAPTMMMLRLPMAEVPGIDVVVSIGGLLLSIPLLLWAGAKVFRLGLLMYGKRPALAQVVRALREA